MSKCVNADRHNPDVILCRKMPGIAVGRLCEKCDGHWCVSADSPLCDSYVRPAEIVRICDECNFGAYGGKCIICGYPGVSDAYYCKECVLMERDRDGCPKAANLGQSRLDAIFQKKRQAPACVCVD